MCVNAQDYLAATNDLQEVLQLDPHVREAEEELEVVTGLFRQSLMDGATDKPRVGEPHYRTHQHDMFTIGSVLEVL